MIKTSIDKIKIYSPNYSIGDMNKLGIQSHNKQPDKELSMMPCAYVDNGDAIIGMNAYIHSEDVPYHLNLKTTNGVFGAWVEFNPNKFDSLEAAVNEIDNHLKETNRFEFQFTGSILSRMDIACDGIMSENAKEYHPVIQSIMKHRYAINEKDLPYSLTYRNTKWQKCSYDKGLKNYLDLSGNKTGIPTRHMRDELRLMTPAYIKNHFGITTLNDALELNDNNLKGLFVDTSKKFIRKQNEIANNKRDEQLDAIIPLMEKLLLLHSRKERILTYLNTSNKETNHIKTRKMFYDAIVEIANRKQWTSKQNKSNFIARELNAFDIMAREQNHIRQQRLKSNEDSITHKLEEYHSKFLVA